MFYRPGQDDHGLPHNPFNALIAPRPIAWVSTVDANGVPNLAPFSFFSGAAYEPPIISIAFTGAKLHARKGERKDTLANIRDTKEFAVNIVPTALKDQMNATTGNYAPEDNEFAIAGVTEAPCRTVSAPRVAESPATLECRLVRLVELPNEGEGENTTVFGRVLGVHIRDDILSNGLVDPTRFNPLARMGYGDYISVTEVFSMKRPT